MSPLRRSPQNEPVTGEPVPLLTARMLTSLRKALGRGGWSLFAAVLIPALLFLYALPVLKLLTKWSPTIPYAWEDRWAQAVSFWTFMLLPFSAAALAWRQTRLLVREEALVPLLLTPLPRRALLLTALRHSLLFRSVVPLLLMPFFVFLIGTFNRMFAMQACGPAPESVLLYFGNSPVCLPMMVAPDTWCHPMHGFRWWFVSWDRSKFPDPCEGAWLLAAANLIWLHAAMRLGVSSGAYCAAAGRGSFRALLRAFLWITAAVGAGLLFVHLLQKYAIIPNYKPGMPNLDAADWAPLNWFGRLVGFRQYTFMTVLAVMNGLAALPVAAAALCSKSLLCAAGRRLDRLAED